MKAFHFAVVLFALALLAGCSKSNPLPKVNNSIEGRWVKPRTWSMGIEVNLRPDGTYRQEFFSDVKGFDGVTTGAYSFDSTTGVLTYGHSTYHRASANGLELLIRSDSWADWQAKKEIYVTLIKISDDPFHEEGIIEQDDPILEQLYSNGVRKK